jgi:hypothetical protein
MYVGAMQGERAEPRVGRRTRCFLPFQIAAGVVESGPTAGASLRYSYSKVVRTNTVPSEESIEYFGVLPFRSRSSVISPDHKYFAILGT